MVKKRAWHKIAAAMAWSLVLLGLAPLRYFCWWGVTHSPRPVSMTFPLKRGEYSPLSSRQNRTSLTKSISSGMIPEESGKL
jgi:hypothetical protein